MRFQAQELQDGINVPVRRGREISPAPACGDTVRRQTPSSQKEDPQWELTGPGTRQSPELDKSVLPELLSLEHLMRQSAAHTD